mmetsp:Transcript_2023/g.7642  ORF Transcript_2023/g.7642 Transcript_2023/m.7642 type:complete len:209 (+) Transcript_2023:97-723(+)
MKSSPPCSPRVGVKYVRIELRCDAESSGLRALLRVLAAMGPGVRSATAAPALMSTFSLFIDTSPHVASTPGGAALALKIGMGVSKSNLCPSSTARRSHSPPESSPRVEGVRSRVAGAGVLKKSRSLCDVCIARRPAPAPTSPLASPSRAASRRVDRSTVHTLAVSSSAHEARHVKSFGHQSTATTSPVWPFSTAGGSSGLSTSHTYTW